MDKIYYRKPNSDFLFTRRPDNLREIYEQKGIEQAERTAETE